MRKLWDLQGDFSALDIGMGFVVFKFDLQSDRAHVLTGGSWTLTDQYITVRAWEPRFKPDEAEEVTMAVWVRFPNFPLEYYNEKHMFRIARRLGRPIKADSTTIETDRGRYDRVCVEVDLKILLKSRVYIEGKIYRVEYENIPILCFGCGRVGHRKDFCSWGTKPPSSPALDTPATASTPVEVEKTTGPNHPGQANSGKAAQLPPYGQWTLVQLVSDSLIRLT